MAESTGNDSSGTTGPEPGSSTGERVETCKGTPVLGESFSYLWVASPDGTLSKIDPATLVEEARYLTRPDGLGNPSRTSVNPNGDVAVANRYGGITMVNALLDDCPDSLTTSSGPDDVRAWPDGCVAWHTPFNYDSQRPVAWTQGTFNETTCRWEGMRLWTAGSRNGETIEVLQLDAEDGSVIGSVDTGYVSDFIFGMYGGAVDANGDFWGSTLGVQRLFRVRYDDLTVDSWPAEVHAYGLTIDAHGRPWTCASNLARFDPEDESWTVVDTPSVAAGCMADANDVLWVAGEDNESLHGYDVETFEQLYDIPTPGFPKGISLDFEGNVFAVGQGTEAWRVDPTTQTVDAVTGLPNAYTYSDMTGYALWLQSGSGR